MYSKYLYGSTKTVGILSGSKIRKEISPFNWWGDGVEIPFGNINVMVPEKYDLYLKKIFGKDYGYVTPDACFQVQKHFEGGL